MPAAGKKGVMSPLWSIPGSYTNNSIPSQDRGSITSLSGSVDGGASRSITNVPFMRPSESSSYNK